MSHPNDASRRAFLLAASATTVTAFGTSVWALPGGNDAGQQLPTRDSLLKFNRDGSVRAFAGNTVICHLPQQCAMRDATVALHEDLAKSAFRSKLALLPAESLHMTVFPGANDQDRTISGWPSDVPLTASIEECNRVVGERMNRFQLDCQLPLRVRVDTKRTLDYGRACTLRMSPADDVENLKLRNLRDSLAEVYRFRLKDHSSYEFHITVAYQMTPFSAMEKDAYTSILETHLPRIVAAAPVLELGIPEFCTFKDMYRFDVQKILSTKA